MSEENAAKTNESLANLNSVIMKKVGMTRIFDNSGSHVPVTVLSIEDAKVLQVKNESVDGYNSVKFAYGEKREKLINQAKKGELKKAGISTNFSKSVETRVDQGSVENIKPGMSIGIDLFSEGDMVNITGITKGKGFAGVVKKYGFAGGPKTHGSKFHRTTGSIGNRATPGKVWKGKKMPGHMGSEKQTIKNLKIVEINMGKGYLLIKGSVPGSKNSYLKVTKA